MLMHSGLSIDNCIGDRGCGELECHSAYTSRSREWLSMLNAWLVNRHTLERTVMCVCCVALFFARKRSIYRGACHSGQSERTVPSRVSFQFVGSRQPSFRRNNLSALCAHVITDRDQNSNAREVTVLLLTPRRFIVSQRLAQHLPFQFF